MTWAVKRFYSESEHTSRAIQNWLDEVAPNTDPRDIKIISYPVKEKRCGPEHSHVIRIAHEMLVFVKGSEPTLLPTEELFASAFAEGGGIP